MARACIVGTQRQLAVVSDIDDTVMVTHLPRPMIAAWNTFVLRESARTPVRGMPEFYRQILDDHPGTLVVYLSTGAWNVAPTLTRFLSRNGFPEGPLLLTDWGPTNSGWFRSGRAHKHAALRRLAREFPQVRWLLIGDDGQHDPQIYGDFAYEQPGKVAAVAIRQLTAVQQVLSGSANVADKHLQPDAVRTVTAGDGLRLASQLEPGDLTKWLGEPDLTPWRRPDPA
jgi:phosphatidate phosphatase APP1